MMRRPVLDYWTDPALEADEDDEPAIWPTEALVIANGTVSWFRLDTDDE